MRETKISGSLRVSHLLGCILCIYIEDGWYFLGVNFYFLQCIGVYHWSISVLFYINLSIMGCHRTWYFSCFSFLLRSLVSGLFPSRHKGGRLDVMCVLQFPTVNSIHSTPSALPCPIQLQCSMIFPQFQFQWRIICVHCTNNTLRFNTFSLCKEHWTFYGKFALCTLHYVLTLES